jgi:hypothetical protein
MTVKHSLSSICDPILIPRLFERSRFYQTDFAAGKEFVEVLDAFLAKLPKDWPYGVEMRNRNWLTPEYFAMLARHGVAHVFNSWTHMPSVNEQLEMPGSITNPQLVGARFLLTPGRKYEDSVKQFQPYHRLQEPNEDARQGWRSTYRWRGALRTSAKDLRLHH